MDHTTDSQKPLYLFADSQLFFWQGGDDSFLQTIRNHLGSHEEKVTTAAYIGASNNDNPAFYEIFRAAMDRIDTHESRMITADPSVNDRMFLEQADLILLAGGDLEMGWNAMKRAEIVDIVRQQYVNGALLFGVSAGAAQLGIGGYGETGSFTETFGFVPHYIGAHDETDDWWALQHAIKNDDAWRKGFGIPGGGGLVYHADATIEPIRYPVKEFVMHDGVMSSAMLVPSSDSSTDLTSPADLH